MDDLTQSQTHEQRAESELPVLQGFGERLIPIAEAILRNETKGGDDFGMMAMVFLAKQTQHLRTLMRLLPHRDAGLIARTMVEGAGLLQWAKKEPQARAKLWVEFAAVHDWRQMKLGNLGD